MSHPDQETSLDALEKRLPSHQQKAFDEHAQSCDQCAGDLREWEEILDNLSCATLSSAPSDYMAKALKIFPAPVESLQTMGIYADLMFDSLAEPSLAGVRGPSDARQVVLRTENLDIDLHISVTGGQTLLWGQLLPRLEQTMIGRVQVTLLCDGERIQSIRTNESGEFRFEGVPGGELSIGVYVPSMSRQVFGVFKVQRN